MYVCGVNGPSDAGKTTLVEALVERLAARGAVATIKHCTHEPDVDTEGKDTARHRAAGADVTYGVTDDAGWFATGESRDLWATLDELAPAYDYAVVEGYGDAAIPQVVLGEGRRDGSAHRVNPGEDGAGGETDEEGTAAVGDGTRGPLGAEVLARGETAGDVDVDDVLGALHETDEHETLESLVAAAEASPAAERAGAVATFTGRVRARDDPDDERTEYLEFERYDAVAADRTAALREELEAREGVHEVLLHHRTGRLHAGEDVVFVVVLAGHRAEAFRAVEDGIDRLKEEVPLFKKEVTVSDAYWRHEL